VRVRDHVLISTAGAALAAPFIRRNALGLWAGGVLIDADHYAWYCLKQRRLSPRAAAQFFNQADPPQYSATRALHAPAAVGAVALLGLRQHRLLPVALGMALHVALDAHHEARMGKARADALKRDDFRCQACDSQESPVHAHVWRQPKLLPSYRMRNLISLCLRCHEEVHMNGKGWGSWG
jgi:hypothetical protein